MKTEKHYSYISILSIFTEHTIYAKNISPVLLTKSFVNLWQHNSLSSAT
jgi:hypothetical protein